MTCNEWEEVLSQIDNWIKSGNWLKKRILIEGDEVEFTSFLQVKAFRDYVENKIFDCQNSLPNTSAGLRTVATYQGSGLQ